MGELHMISATQNISKFRSVFAIGSSLLLGLITGVAIQTQGSIAASTQLSNLLYNMTVRFNGNVRYYKFTAADYDQAYTYSWSEFVNIVDTNTIAPLWSPSAGAIYTANLKGGGTANNRQYGSTIPLTPTIDLLRHNTPPLNGQPFAQVNEVKFPYTKPFCAAATTSC